MDNWVKKFEKVYANLESSDDSDMLTEIQEDENGEFYINKGKTYHGSCFETISLPIIIQDKEIDVIRNEFGFQLVLKMRSCY